MNRYFAGIAVPICPRLLAAKAELESRAKARGLVLRESAAEDLHLTLHFFGPISAEKLADARAALAEVSARTAPFSLTIAGMDAFPDSRAARVLWAGVSNSPPLLQLAEEIAKAVSGRGFPREARPFAPHITLARMKPPGSAAELLAGTQSSGGESFLVREIIFYESRGGDFRPRYLPKERLGLSGS